MLKVEIKGKFMVISVPLTETPSKSGKSILRATTNGNKPTDLKIDGENVVVSVNAYTKIK